MYKELLFLVLFSSLFFSGQLIGDEDISCTTKFCSNVECTELPDQCKTEDPNAAIFMLSPDICNCCPYCLINLAEGESCSVGSPSNGKHTSICGPGLTCKTTRDDATDGTCQKMETPCALEQQSYESRRQEGLLGTMEARITCDDDGQYGNYKCIPGQTCHCLHLNGSRIFGDANYNSISDYMTCECSRKYQEAVAILGRDLQPHEHFRCASDGSYDRVQCIDEKCLCVDSADGAPTYPSNRMVALSEISRTTLPCYTSEIPGKYYEACEENYLKVLREVEAVKNSTDSKYVFGYSFPKCDLDGTYAPVQENKTHKFCVDKEGKPLTVLDKSDSTSKTLINDMNCNCVRANLITTTIEKPQCLLNGNYNPVQCRKGVCRCVDANGHQKCSSSKAACEEVDESQKSKLKC